jgi:HTH-type transcriptional regulator / antitoxin HipB
MKKKIKSYSLDEVKDKFIGKKGSSKRDLYEQELQMDVIGELIKKTRQDRNLTQEELGKLIGVQKAQISKLESHTGNVTLTTIIKVFTALNAKLKFNLELDGKRVKLA